MKNVVFIAGVIVLVLAALAYGYTVTESNSYFGGFYTSENVEAPYRDYSFPLFVGGIVLIIVGAVLPPRSGD